MPRLRRGYSVEMSRGDAAATWIFSGDARLRYIRAPFLGVPRAPVVSDLVQLFDATVATTLELANVTARHVLSPRGYSADGSRRRRGCDVDVLCRRLVAPPRLRRGYSV